MASSGMARFRAGPDAAGGGEFKSHLRHQEEHQLTKAPALVNGFFGVSRVGVETPKSAVCPRFVSTVIFEVVKRRTWCVDRAAGEPLGP